MDCFSQTSHMAVLAMRMKTSLGQAGREYADRHARAVLAFRKGGGGFAGRRGAADVYYTGFAVRALHALGRIEPEVGAETMTYLRAQTPRNLIDELSILNGLLLMQGDAPEAQGVLDFVEGFRASDGGYGKMRGARAGSAYHTFLAALCYDLFGRKVPDGDRLLRFIEGQGRSDGGFCDLAGAKQSNTNATAAALSVMVLLRAMDWKRMEEARDYLLRMRDKGGGWLATRSAPCPDLLSTHTALVTLAQMGAMDSETLADALGFARSCERNGGGFLACPWDDQDDVEYTYYGLGVVALGIEMGLRT